MIRQYLKRYPAAKAEVLAVMINRHVNAKRAEILSLEEAVKKYMHNDIMLCTGGFTAMNRKPVAWIWETIKQGFKGIHNLDPSGNTAAWLLNAAGIMSIHETSWTGWGEMAGKLDAESCNRFKEGKLIVEEHAHGAMAARFLAGAFGLPFMPYYAPPGSDLYNPEYDAIGRAGLRNGGSSKIAAKKFVPFEDPFFNEGTVYLLPAARPELAIIHVAQAGEKGTARWRGITSLDKEMAFASDKVVLTCEEIVSEAELRKQPESNQIPFFVVDCIVKVPYGAYPSGVPYRYDYDAKFIQAMQTASRNKEELKKWMDEWIYGPNNWQAFLDKVGKKRLLLLKANKNLGYSTKLVRGKKPSPSIKTPLSIMKSGF
jgi:glutaconate CoA-transferase, subunit A